MELINRDLLVGKDGLFAKRGCPGNCQYCGLWSKEGCRVILEVPTVDAVVVAHGHWIHDDEYDICSVCNNPVIMNRLSPDKWCKNCGAKMDGGKDGN
jgi:hypothetical protein